MQKLLVDTNILLLWIVGTFDQESIRSYRRTAHFAPSDFDLLLRHRLRFGQALTTAPILTEVSNLLGNTFHVNVASTFVAIGNELVEIARLKDDVFNVEGFDRLGFADCATLSVMDEDTTLLTDDVPLYSQALFFGFEAVNFNHLRNFS